MTTNNKVNPLFKSYLKAAWPYLGGKSKKEVKTESENIYKLSSNENPIGASPKALEAIRKNLDSLFEYPDRTDQRLRIALEEYYGGQLKENQFIGGGGGSETLELIIRAFTTAHSQCIITNPAFGPYRLFSNWNGVRIVDVPLLKPNYKLDVPGILSAITPQTRLIFLTSPNNPTGTYIPKRELDFLIEKLPEHVVLVLDEVYHHFAEAADYTSALPYVLEGRQVIGVNSFSKTYGLASLRVGYCYSTPGIAAYIRQICRPFLINLLSMEAAIAALTDHEFINQTLQLVRKEKSYLYPALDRLKVKYWKSEANFILIEPEISAQQFESRMLEAGVMVRPVANFGAPGCVRVTIGNREANEVFIRALESIRGS